MDLQIYELDSNILGKTLGQKLFSPKGGLLLGMGAEIKEFHFRKIREVGYRSIYLMENQTNDVLESTGHVVSEKIRATAPITLKDIFEKLRGRDKIQISNAKKELGALADLLIRDVDTKMGGAPDIIDLKRERDYIYQHAINVAAYAIMIGESIQYHQLKLYDLTMAALLADFGMLYLDPDILYKEGELEEKEIEEMHKHTILGFQHLSRNCFIKGIVAAVCLQHHERYDGSGYPKGLTGENIHEYSRIIALADFFDAYTSDRPYRRLHTIDEALAHIKEHSDVKFDPRMVTHFLKFFEFGEND